MGELFRTARYRLLLSAAQAQSMAQHAGICRYVYNLALEQRRDWQRQFKATTGQYISFYSQCLELRSLRSEVDWIGGGIQSAQVQALWDLDEAFRRFRQGKSGYPSPRRKGEHASFRIPAREVYSPIKVGSNPRYAAIRLPKIGWCTFRLSKQLPSEFRLTEVTVAMDALGWHISIGIRVPSPKTLGLRGSIGIDRGATKTLSFSDGTFATQPLSALRALERTVSFHQRRMARQERGSNRRSDTRVLLAKAKAKAARIRKHWNHEQTTRIAANYGTVVIEALKTKAMTRSVKGTVAAPGINVRQKAGLNRSILEHGWYQFEQLLAYKLEAAGGQLVKVDPAYTSQTCSACGSISKMHRKSQAVFECCDCGHAAHADTNAALNILRAGERPASRGAVRPSVKREPSAEFTQ